MNNSDISILLKTLKKQLKVKGWTYKDLANELSLSEVSVKRIFSTQDCTLSRLSEICDLIGTSIIDLSELAKVSSENENFFLNSQQEKYFCKHPGLFALFRQLYRGDSPEEVAQAWNLKPNQLFEVLREFEKIKLLEVHPGNKVKFLISGRLRLNLNGPFFSKVMKKQNIDFLEAVYQTHTIPECSFQSSDLQMTKKSLLAMVDELHEIGRRYRAISYREERTLQRSKLIDVRWLFALMPYKTNWK